MTGRPIGRWAPDQDLGPEQYGEEGDGAIGSISVTSAVEPTAELRAPFTVLVVCTANICRSPMFELLLQRDVSELEPHVRVESAGIIEWDEPVDDDAVEVMLSRDLDLSGHRSRSVLDLDLGVYDLILTMTREQLRTVAVEQPKLLRRTFTVKEFARRIGFTDPVIVLSGATPRERVRVFSAERRMADLLGESHADDVADPHGLPPKFFEATLAELEVLSATIAPVIAAVSR